jgi:hypothetical protein
MKKYLNNPVFYYIALPAAACLWAALAGLVFYPRATSSWQESQAEYNAAEELLAQIIAVEPQRLAYKQEKGTAVVDFDFTQVINEFASLFSIPSSNFTLNTRGEIRKAGKRARSAVLSIKTIDIEKTTKFLSTMLIRWPDLQCEILSLDKLPQGKNNWKVDMTLTYYY